MFVFLSYPNLSCVVFDLSWLSGLVWSWWFWWSCLVLPCLGSSARCLGAHSLRCSCSLWPLVASAGPSWLLTLGPSASVLFPMTAAAFGSTAGPKWLCGAGSSGQTSPPIYAVLAFSLTFCFLPENVWKWLQAKWSETLKWPQIAVTSMIHNDSWSSSRIYNDFWNFLWFLWRIVDGVLILFLLMLAPKIALIGLCTSRGALCTSRKMVLCTSRGALCTSRKGGPLHVQWGRLYVQEALCTSGVAGGRPVRPRGPLDVQGRYLYVEEGFCTCSGALCASRGASVRSGP